MPETGAVCTSIAPDSDQEPTYKLVDDMTKTKVMRGEEGGKTIEKKK